MRKRLKVNSESGKALLQTFPETASVHCMHRIATPGHRQQTAMSTKTKTWNATQYWRPNDTTLVIALESFDRMSVKD